MWLRSWRLDNDPPVVCSTSEYVLALVTLRRSKLVLDRSGLSGKQVTETPTTGLTCYPKGRSYPVAATDSQRQFARADAAADLAELRKPDGAAVDAVPVRLWWYAADRLDGCRWIAEAAPTYAYGVSTAPSAMAVTDRASAS